jgi:DUF971 family protein
MNTRPWPTEIKLRRSARRLDVAFDTGERFEIPFELLRVMTPAADERGHAGMNDPKPLPLDKRGVGVTDVTPIGRYAVRISFDDDHNTGLYTWEILHRLGRDRLKLEAEHAKMVGRTA